MPPNTIPQPIYINPIKPNHLLFRIPPPPTPKTFLPLLYPPKQLPKPSLNPILLTTPPLQPAQSLPFLPPHLKQKLHPYLTPL
ncbi:PhoH family protein, partial [Staphylococcus epidermidis]|uniref:PhoH family protein n=1 Tax=Staphylococcus epidermidis TaxID=1282 RepID=UPI0037D9943F